MDNLIGSSIHLHILASDQTWGSSCYTAETELETYPCEPVKIQIKHLEANRTARQIIVQDK